jgi:hypothetical protein
VRIWVLSAVSFALFFCAVLMLVRAQPNDDSSLRAFLDAPADCTTPCWQGIQPGTTPGHQALRLLQHHPWIDHIEPWGYASTLLRWNGQQPAYVDDSYPGILTIESGIVERISIPTTITFGDLWLLYDQPARGGFICLGRASRNAVLHFATYPDAGFAVSLKNGLPASCRPNVDSEACPIALPTLWNAPFDLIVGPVYVQLDDYAVIRSDSPPFCMR